MQATRHIAPQRPIRRLNGTRRASHHKMLRSAGGGASEQERIHARARFILRIGLRTGPACSARIELPASDYFSAVCAQKSSNSTAISNTSPRPNRMGRARAPIPLYLGELKIMRTLNAEAG